MKHYNKSLTTVTVSVARFSHKSRLIFW